MEDKKKEGKILFLFLIPTLVIFCAFFMPLAKVSSYTVFRGRELFELYWNWIEYAPPARGYGLFVSLFRAIPFLAVPVMAMALFGWRHLTALFAAAFSVVCLVLTLGLAGPGYEPLVSLANPAELGMPLPKPGLWALIEQGHAGSGFLLIFAGSLVLLVYSVYRLRVGENAPVSERIEQVLQNAFRRNVRQWMVIFALLGIWGVFYAITENGVFLSSRNLSNLFLQSAATAVIAIGVVLVLVTRNIDLSIGSVVGFIGAIAAVTQVESSLAHWLLGVLRSMGLPGDFMAVFGIVAALLTGLAIGAWHGLWIAYLGVPAFIVTLSSMMVFRGGLLYFTGGKSIANMYPWFQAIGNEYVSPQNSVWLAGLFILFYIFREMRQRVIRKRNDFGVPPVVAQLAKTIVVGVAIYLFFAIMIRYRGIPYAWLIVLVVMLIFSFIAEKTTFGRHLYAIGGNAEAARLSGINIKWKIMAMYMLTGFVVAIGGIIYLSRLNSATANAGSGMELDCIASAVIGGASLMGGEGSIYGGVVGALVMGSLDNGMSLLNLNATWQYTVKGLVLLVAVWGDMAIRRRGN